MIWLEMISLEGKQFRQGFQLPKIECLVCTPMDNEYGGENRIQGIWRR